MQNTYNIRNYVFLDLEPTPIHLIPNLTRIDFTGLEGDTFKHGARVFSVNNISFSKKHQKELDTLIKKNETGTWVDLIEIKHKHLINFIKDIQIKI